MKELVKKEKKGIEMNEIVPIIENKDGINVVSSRTIAEQLSKRHADVLESIENIIKNNSTEISVQFIKSIYKDKSGKSNKEYLLTKDGFILYMFNIQGYNEFKMRYINEFNRMEEYIKQNIQQYKLPQNYVEALKQLITQVETNEELQKINSMQQQQLGELKPIKEYYDEILNSKGTMKITQIAADYDMSATKLNRILNDKGLIRKIGDQWILYSKHMGKGYTKSETYEFAKDDYKPLTVWTQKGRLKIHEILTNLGIKAHMDKTKGQKQLF